MLGLTLCTLLVTNVVCAQSSVSRYFVYNIYNFDTWIPIVLNETTEQILDFEEENATGSHYPTRVHVSAVGLVTQDYPLLITAVQQKGVSSWELPLSAGRARFSDMARTLCPHDAGPNLTLVRPPRLEVSTASPRDLAVTIKLRRVLDFYLRMNQELSFRVNSPSAPKYFYFSFDSPSTPSSNSSVDSILLTVDSDDQICAIVSIQDNSCPVFDNEQEILYQGHHLTMTTKGGITLTRAMYPRGFYVVFVVKLSDGDCTGGDREPAPGNRTKMFRVRAASPLSPRQYWESGAALLAVLLAVWLLNVLLACCCRCPEPQVLVEELAGSPSSAPLETMGACPSDSGSNPLGPAEDGASSSDSEQSAREAASGQWDAPTLLQLCRAEPRLLRRRADRYVWGALTLAIVYTLPVMQLLITYQNMASSTGDQDLCYYNFLCAHPLGALSDGNHVLSNVPYVLLGGAFMLHVRRAAHKHRSQQQAAARGVPPQHGLLHALGLALAMEGVLSACYHLCPNKMNFQFDSSFMYVMAVLWLVALYRRRHADLVAPAHRTFALIAGLIATGVAGITFPTLWFWSLFTLAHVAACLLLTLHLYYFGQLKLDRGLGARVWAARGAGRHVLHVWTARGGGRHVLHALRPRRPARAALLLLMNLVNWALAGLGLYRHNEDFARHLLLVLLTNTLLYSLVYIACKGLQRERLSPRCVALLVLATVCWAAAGAFFLDGKSKWRETPAHSRAHNAACLALGYDTHDLWHAASAAALYLSFNLLLHIDDPLGDTPRHLIAVF